MVRAMRFHARLSDPGAAHLRTGRTGTMERIVDLIEVLTGHEEVGLQVAVGDRLVDVARMEWQPDRGVLVMRLADAAPADGS